MEQFVLTPIQQSAIDAFSHHQGIMRTSHALAQGIYQKTLYSLKDLGLIEPLARGVYRLVDSDLPPHMELITISLLHPQTVFCLITALDFHHITTEIPKAIYVALPQGAKAPKVRGYRIHAFYFTQAQLEAGIEVHEVTGFKIKVFSPEKSVVDCFKYANKIGQRTAVEALKLCIAERNSTAADFLKFAQIARVSRRMQPYLEAIYY